MLQMNLLVIVSIGVQFLGLLQMTQNAIDTTVPTNHFVGDRHVGIHKDTIIYFLRHVQNVEVLP